MDAAEKLLRSQVCEQNISEELQIQFDINKHVVVQSIALAKMRIAKY